MSEEKMTIEEIRGASIAWRIFDEHITRARMGCVGSEEAWHLLDSVGDDVRVALECRSGFNIKPEFDVKALRAAIQGGLDHVVVFGHSKVVIDEEFVRVSIHCGSEPTKRMIRFMDDAGYEVVLSNPQGGYCANDRTEYWWRRKPVIDKERPSQGA